MLCPCGVKRVYWAWNTRREETTLTETASSIPISQPAHFLRSATLGNLVRQARISKLAKDKEWSTIYPYPPPVYRVPGPPSLCGQGTPSLYGEGNYSSHHAPASPSLKEEGTYREIDK